MSLAAYLDELQDLPPLMISHALKRLVRRSGEFAPSVAVIRREVAHVLREAHRSASGLDPTAGLPEDGINVDAWLKRAHEPIPASRQLTSGAPPAEEKATPEQRAQGARLLAELVEKMQI